MDDTSLPRRRYIKVCLYNLFFIVLFTTAVADDFEADYMSNLLRALTPTPQGWSLNTSFCRWNGVLCNQTTSSVYSISLPSSSLKGTLPPFLEVSLPNLIHLDLHNNSLTGSLPGLSALSNLQTVNLGHNNFNFMEGASLRWLTALHTFNLSKNLNLPPWVFPNDLASSQSLQTLDLQSTNIIGSLPPQMLEWFPHLETLFLSHNNLTGPLPYSLARSAVKYLKLNEQGQWNGFTGSIEVISSMRLLSQAWLNNNAFTGQIPAFSNSTHLFDLQIHFNALTGLVPRSLMALSSLKRVSLDNNNLIGPIPVFRDKVNATWEGNNFCRKDVGPCNPVMTIWLKIVEAFRYPDFLYWRGGDPCDSWYGIQCTRGKIISIDFRDMGLNGTVSPAFAYLTALVNLTLSGNNFSGSIPDSLTTLSQLQLLDVSNNNLSGEVPNFSSKVKLNTTGNVFLGLSIRRRGGGGGRDNRTHASHDHATSKTHPKATSVGSARKLSIGIGTFSFGVGIIILIICQGKRIFDFMHKRMFKGTTTLLEDNVEDFIKSYNLSVIKRYSYAEVTQITNSFQDKLGQGGYGVVYKANLSDGRQVAVKLINECKGDGEEFINEVASISRTSHVNIVSLLGFCYEMNKRALIYEFMPNGSLDKFIYRSGFQSAICSLDWNTLYQIAVGIARGLEYLHQGCTSRILHLDIKPQNILLDKDFCPKISDFGLAKICKQRDSIVSIIGTRGTIGFIAPEVFSRAFGGVSHKSDVYSFGMLILEMIGGRKNYDTRGSCTTEMYFPDWIYKDLCLSDDLKNCLAISEEETNMVRKIAMVSLWCIQTNPLHRPSMSKLIEMLQGSLESVPYPPKPVLYSPENPSLQSSYLSSKNLLETSSINV